MRSAQSRPVRVPEAVAILFGQLGIRNSWPCVPVLPSRICQANSSRCLTVTSIAPPLCRRFVRTLFRWSLLSSEDKPSAIVETTKTKDTPRQLESNATSDWLDSLTTTYGHFSDGADNSQTDVTERPTVKATRRSRMTRSRLWAKIAISMAIYALCCCIHYFLTRIIRLFKPSVKLPFALTFPKPQVSGTGETRASHRACHFR